MGAAFIRREGGQHGGGQRSSRGLGRGIQAQRTSRAGLGKRLPNIRGPKLLGLEPLHFLCPWSMYCLHCCTPALVAHTPTCAHTPVGTLRSVERTYLQDMLPSASMLT